MGFSQPLETVETLLGFLGYRAAVEDQVRFSTRGTRLNNYIIIKQIINNDA